MEINGVKLPSEKSFNAAARKFRQMFNDGPSLDTPSCYIKLTDGKLECVWGKTKTYEDVHLFGKGGLDINVDKIVLTSAFLYSRTFPSRIATIRDVRLALALTLARYDVAQHMEIAKYYNINASYFEEEWRRRNAEN